jgi:hypothetical protein
MPLLRVIAGIIRYVGGFITPFLVFHVVDFVRLQGSSGTDLPFEKAREAFRIGEWMREVPLDDTFSERLREFLKRQGADNVPP